MSIDTIKNLPFTLVTAVDSYDYDSSQALLFVNDDNVMMNIRRYDFVSWNLFNQCGGGDAVDYDLYALPKDLPLVSYSSKIEDGMTKYSFTVEKRLAGMVDTLKEVYLAEVKSQAPKDFKFEVEFKVSENDFTLDEDELTDIVKNWHFNLDTDLDYITGEWNEWIEAGKDKQDLTTPPAPKKYEPIVVDKDTDVDSDEDTIPF